MLCHYYYLFPAIFYVINIMFFTSDKANIKLKKDISFRHNSLTVPIEYGMNTVLSN